MRWVVPVALVVGTAHADPPRLAVDSPVAVRVDRARVRIDAEHGRALLSIALSSRDATPQAGSLAIRVPRGSRASALTVAVGGVRATARSMDSLDARAAFADVGGPVLLEQSAGEPDRLVLRVVPLVRGAPVAVEIAIELPAIPAVTVAAPIEIDGPRSVALPRRAWMEDDPAPRSIVDARTSLFAAGDRAAAVPTVVIGAPVSSCECEPGPTFRSIRKWIRLQIPRLRHCYMTEAQRDPSLEGDADLHFTIDTDGRTSDIAVDGSLDDAEVTSCLAGEVATWQFGAGRGATRVNYPLHFQLAR